MDSDRFDSITRLFAARPLSRRAALAAAAGLLAAAGLRQGVGAQVSQVVCGNVFCGSNPGVCNDGCVCCVYSNGNSRCRPPGTCGPGQAVCPGGEVVDPVLGCVAPTTTTTSTTTSTTTTTTTTTTTPAPSVCAGAADGTVCGTGNVGFCDGGECFRAAPTCSYDNGCFISSARSAAIPSVEFCLKPGSSQSPCASSADCGAGQFCSFPTGGAPNNCLAGCQDV